MELFQQIEGQGNPTTCSRPSSAGTGEMGICQSGYGRAFIGNKSLFSLTHLAIEKWGECAFRLSGCLHATLSSVTAAYRMIPQVVESQCVL
jgi:hypothetical protein